MNFAQRMGIEPATQPLQIDSMNTELRTGLWNVLEMQFWSRVRNAGSDYSPISLKNEWVLVTRLWRDFFKRPLDTVSNFGFAIVADIRDWYFGMVTPWYEIYKLVEFLAHHAPLIYQEPSKFRDVCNAMLEREWSGLRFVGELLAPVTDPAEIAAINAAASFNQDILAPVSMHIRKATELLSKKPQPDFSNSIKESISAVEAVCKIIAKKPDATLGPALDALAPKIKLHPALQEGYKKIYGYTSDTHGIRHALKDEQVAEAEDAKYMLVSCSGFVNYLVVKAQKAGLI